MTWRISHAYPCLFAIIPVVRLVAAYPGWVDLDDAAIVVTAVLAACGILYGLALLVTHRRVLRLPPLVLLGIVAAFWGYVRVAAFVQHRARVSDALLLPLWVAATVAIIWWLVRRPALLDRAESFLTLTGGVLVGWFVLSVAAAEYRSARALRHSGVVRWLTEPVRLQRGAKVGPKRDIYLIVLDEYANAEVTGHLFGFDNHAFLDSLRHLGFVVPAVHSNYLHTFLSVPSLLNAAHVAGLADELGRPSIDRTITDYLVRHNRTVPFLKSQGYQYVFFPTPSWEATQHDPRADVEFDAVPGWSPARVVKRSDFRQVLNKTSLLKFVDWKADRLVRAHVTGTFAGVSRIPEMPGPVFAFAHVMSPHSPYLFDRDCRPVRHDPSASRGQQAGAIYVAQIQCVNALVLDMVTRVLRTSELPPVILLQGDHGSKTLLSNKDRIPEQITLAAGKERLGAFGAYYLPDHGSEVFGDSVTIVNVMGNVLRHYLGADLPREPDAMYLSTHRTPYAFKRVDFAWLAGEDWSDRGRAEGGR